MHTAMTPRTDRTAPEMSYTSMRQLGMHQMVPYQSAATVSTVRSADAPFVQTPYGRPTHSMNTQMPQVASYPTGLGTHHAPFTHTPSTAVDPVVRNAAGRKPKRKQWAAR